MSKTLVIFLITVVLVMASGVLINMYLDGPMGDVLFVLVPALLMVAGFFIANNKD